MLKEVLLEKNITTYRLAKDINEPYSTVNDIVNGKVDIADCKSKVLKKISDYLEQPMEITYEQCSLNQGVYSKEYDVLGIISVKHKKYYLEFVYEDEVFDLEMGKVTEITSMFILEVALYEMEKKISQRRMEKYICSM